MSEVLLVGDLLIPPLAQLPFPPHEPLAGSESGSFAEATITKRLPSIVEGVLVDGEALYKQYAGNEAALAQVRAALGAIAALRESMLANAELPDLQAPSGAAASLCQAALFGMVAGTNGALRAWKARAPEGTWLGLPWLLVECYMYTAIATAIQSQPVLAGSCTGPRFGSHQSEQDLGTYDPFATQKTTGWVKSAAAVADLAAAAEAIHASLREVGILRGPQHNVAREGALRARLFEVVQYCLWGNKTDLSLLKTASLPTSLEKLVQEGDSSAHASPSPLIVNEFELLWQHLRGAARQGGAGRVDFILDNSGLELYGDLVLADFLIETGLATQVVFHGKSVPWFVSDATVTDFAQTLVACQLPHPPAGAAGASGGSNGNGNGAEMSSSSSVGWTAVARLGKRWAEHVAAGRWRFTDHAFWTTPAPFCWMAQMAPSLHAELASSSCIISKGDLNYRKLTSDCRWPSDVPWKESLMGFAPAPLLSLRTCKADVATGLQPGQAEALSAVDSEWQVNGSYAMLQFVPRA